MADSTDQVPTEFAECVVLLGAEKAPFRFLGRIRAKVQREWDNGILRCYVLYETLDGQFVRTVSVLEDHVNQCAIGGFDIADIFDTPESACASLADKELRAELLLKRRVGSKHSNPGQSGHRTSKLRTLPL